MTDYAVPVIDVELRVRNLVLSSPVPPAVTLGPFATPQTYRVAASTIFGTVTADLTKARVLSVNWPAINAPTQATFTVPFDDPNLAELPLATGTTEDSVDDTTNREVKIWRNNVLIFWGPCVTRRADSTNRVWIYTAYDPMWYLLHRYMGEATRHNYLTNPSFEESGGSFIGWSEVGSPTGITVNDDYALGDGAGAGASAFIQTFTNGEDAYIYQNFAVTTGAQGRAYIATAWVKKDSGFVGPAINSTGLQLRALTSAVVSSAILDASTPSYQWVRQSVAILVPPNVTDTVQIRLYAPNGGAFWDACSVVVEESLSAVKINSPGGTGWDQVLIAQGIVRYAAGGLAVGDPYTKSGLHIGVAGDDSGIIKERTYQFADHQKCYGGGQGGGALDEFFAASDGFDYRLIQSETARIFTTYYPACGRNWTGDLTLTYSRTFDVDGNPDGTYVGITAYDWGEAAEGAANDVTILGGWGSGAGREEGGYADPTTFGTLTLEFIDSAPPEASIDQLDAIARAKFDQLAVTQRTPVLTVIEPRDPGTGEVSIALIGALLPGDLVPVLIDDGGFGWSSTARVLAVNYDTVAETLTVAILPDPGGSRVPA